LSLERPALGWLILGWTAWAVLPWYAAGGWIPALTSGAGPGLVEALAGRWWLLVTGLPLLPASWAALREAPRAVRGTWLASSGVVGAGLLLAQGFLIDHRGWTLALPGVLFGEVTGQGAVGLGALCLLAAYLGLLAHGLARRGLFAGDTFLSASVVFIATAIGLLILYPLSLVGLAMFYDRGAFAPETFIARATAPAVWAVACIGGGGSCGTAINTVGLGLATATSSTVLGLAFALVALRTGFPFKRLLRLFGILPIITPPFVIGLSLILLFGRAGIATNFVADLLGIAPSRWIYGFMGVWIAQVLSFTPLAFLVLVGVLQAMNPTLEEAAQTLRATSGQVLRTVTLPLLAPGLANAFLLCFIESLADFGNPLVLGGGFRVLSTEIFFAVVGAQYDPGRAATLGLVLLSLSLGAFFLQRALLARRAFVTVTGKGDAGSPVALPVTVARAATGIVLAWAAFTLAVYLIIMFGGFVELWGRNWSPTLRHYERAFGFAWDESGLRLIGGAWPSLFTTLWICAVAAPLTAGAGLLAAYVLQRRQFPGRGILEFMTLLCFATPGTVVGLSYIIAFNTPPFEMTGTALILILSFVSRNLPVGVRAGMASLSQIDKSLDEASLTLRAGTAGTLRRVVMPLIKPAIVAALIYGFVGAVTAVSAVIFLVSARYDLATSYIIRRVDNADYGVAIAYCSVLILVMVGAIALIQLFVGERATGRRPAAATEPDATLGAPQWTRA
jgi:iron(III) transport system permease protein